MWAFTTRIVTTTGFYTVGLSIYTGFWFYDQKFPNVIETIANNPMKTKSYSFIITSTTTKLA